MDCSTLPIAFFRIISMLRVRGHHLLPVNPPIRHYHLHPHPPPRFTFPEWPPLGYLLVWCFTLHFRIQYRIQVPLTQGQSTSLEGLAFSISSFL
jgi:hypothetical protein